MGGILSRFRKKKTTIEVLEDLESKIKEIEQYGQSTEQRHKKIVGTLVIYSVILYIMTAFIFYFYFFPASLYDQLFYITPLLIFPILILLTKKMVSWYYKRKISRNQEKLVEMQKEKKKILDEVTETETYKKAKEILLKFAPDQLRMTPLSPQQPSKSVEATPSRISPQSVLPPMPGMPELRKRVLATPNQPNPSVNPGVTPSGRTTTITTLRGTPMPLGSKGVSIPADPIGMASMYTPQRASAMPLGSRVANTPATALPGLPRPILSQNRSYFDRLVEYLVGDGPSNRYALICRQCDSHNGMALKEEFEYFGFRCCYCNFWNPARKQKPPAPRLQYTSPLRGIPGNDAHSAVSTAMQQPKPPEPEVSSHSDTDSDIEVVEKPNEASDMPDSNTEQSLKKEETDVVNAGVVTAEEGISNAKEVEETGELDDGIEKMDVDDLPEKS